MMYDFEQGIMYNRRVDIHGRFGGQQQGGISTPANFPLIFIFTGETGRDFGYRDEFRPNGLFWYTGEGQEGDMQMLRGNLALRNHYEQGKKVLLFEYVKSGQVRFINEVICVDYHTEQRPDKSGNQRSAYIFHLAIIPTRTENVFHEPEPHYHLKLKNLRKKSLAEL